MKIAVTSRGTKGVLEFMRRALPRTYAVVKKELQTGAQLQGLALTEPSQTASEQPPTSSLANTIKEIAQVAAQAYLTKEQIDAQNRILNIQLQRAQNGQPLLAIDPQEYGLPSPSVGVGLTADTKQLLMIGGGIAAALFLFSTFMGRRRG
jgi:hypothetical protein